MSSWWYYQSRLIPLTKNLKNITKIVRRTRQNVITLHKNQWINILRIKIIKSRAVPTRCNTKSLPGLWQQSLETYNTLGSMGSDRYETASSVVLGSGARDVLMLFFMIRQCISWTQIETHKHAHMNPLYLPSQTTVPV